VPPALVGPTEDLGRPSKILLVDDEHEFVHTLSERLQARNLDAAVVYDGEEALSFVASDEPEVMVLDLKMPGIDGIEVLRRVKQEHPAVEVIILTGHGSKKEEQEAKRLGAFAYLRKPVNIDVLTKTMTRAYHKIGKRPPSEGSSSED
jgi:DNA-binding NtrC family response regulator